MRKRYAAFYFYDVLECIEKIEKYTAGMDLYLFIQDEKTIDAVIKNIIIAGEAFRLIPDEIRMKYPEIEYREIIGMRNILVHNYLGTDFEEVWKTVEEEIPVLKQQVQFILKNLEDLE